MVAGRLLRNERETGYRVGSTCVCTNVLLNWASSYKSQHVDRSSQDREARKGKPNSHAKTPVLPADLPPLQALSAIKS